MAKTLKIEFQETAEKEIVSKLTSAISKNRHSHEILLQAPTGAGKTKMVSSALLQASKFFARTGDAVTYIWIAPRTLHEQSFDRIKQFFKSTALKCYLLDNSSELYFKENTICFFNWDSINKKGNVLVKDTEQETGLAQKIKKTKDKDIKIITIIDESHFAAGAEGARQVIEKIDPDVILKVSATPVESSQDRVYVDRQDVVESGMIRDAIVINPSSILKYSEKSKTTELTVNVEKEISPTALIKEAVVLRNELKQLYSQEGSNIEPLILVQFPDASAYGPDVNKLKNEILDVLDAEYGWKSGQEIAQWFDTTKIGLDLDKNGNDLISFASDVKVLFFKQAISLGWDCPRAQILVEFREFKSETFKIQVLGRILRQPEHKNYQNPALNKGYVLTNNKSIAIKGEAITLFNMHISKINQKFLTESLIVPLPFYQYKNLDERNFLRQDVTQDFINQLECYKNSFKFSDVCKESIVKDHVLEDVDSAEGHLKNVELTQGLLTGDTLSMIYDLFFKGQMRQLADMYQGRKYLKAGWEKFFQSLFSHEISDKIKMLRVAQSASSDEDLLTISEDVLIKHLTRCSLFANTTLVEACLKNAIDSHLQKYEDPKKKEIISISAWQIPYYQEYSTDKPVSSGYVKCLYQFHAGLNGIEKEFAAYLDNNESILWWLKNRDAGKQNFAIRYIDENNNEALFYPDFVVKYTDGSFGVYDPKGWGREGSAMSKNTAAKINALFSYTLKLNTAGVKIMSGVIVKEDNKLYLYPNDRKTYPYPMPTNLDNWDCLS